MLMKVIDLVKDYWVQIVFLAGIIGSFLTLLKSYREATKCSLRNDMLEIWDKCKDKKQITRYQLESFIESRDLYFRLKGDGFIHRIDDIIKTFEVID